MKTRAGIAAAAVALVVMGLILGLSGCSTTGTTGGSSGGGGGALTAYAGSDPKGDYIVIEFDTASSLVRRINFTTGKTNGWYSYSTLPHTSPYANGFSVVKQAVIESNSVTNFFALFAEYPGAACVYMLVMETNGAEGFVVENPAYAVYRQTLSQSDLYGTAYNWMRFTIDGSGSGSDMEAGIASFDSSGTGGIMFGAGYSRQNQTGTDLNNCGFFDIDDGTNLYVTNFTANAAAGSLTVWYNGVGDWPNALSIAGTPSGAVILDFGTNIGGGAGIAIPQSSLAADPVTWWNTVGGVYMTVIYEYNSQTAQSLIEPLKIQVGAGGLVKVFNFTNHVSVDPDISNYLTMISNADLAQSPCSAYTPMELLAHFAGNTNASSAVVRDAHFGLGGYLYTTNDVTLFAMFDPQGRFMSFNMFEDLGAGNYIIRFGFGIRDSSYNDGF